jgi:signal peptidase I
MQPLSRPCDMCSEERKFWTVLTDLLDAGRQVRFNPSGTSMGPFIRQGDVVTVRPCSLSDLAFGDIVLFSAGREMYRVHRIVERFQADGRSLFVTRGDACQDTDSPISPEDILGKVSVVTKGRWTLDLDKPCGKAINLAWAHSQRWPVSMGMLRTGGKLMKSLIGLCGFSGLFSLFWGEAKP